MTGKIKTQTCCIPPAAGGKCTVESLISVDERGQMVLPKDVRAKAGIKPGDKLTLVSWEKDGKVCCLCLVKADELTDMIKSILRPVMKDMLE